MHGISTASTRATVRSQLAAADLSDRVLEAAERRLEPLRAEDGAQAAEYAMLGGVSAAICGILVYLLKNTNLVRGILEAVFNGITSTIRAWFS